MFFSRQAGLVLLAVLTAGCLALDDKSAPPPPEAASFTAGAMADSEALVAPKMMRAKNNSVTMAADAAAEESFTVPEGRKMTFNATYRLTVPDIQTAQNTAKAAAEKLGGYMQSVNDFSMTLRIPMAQASAALAMVSELGRVNGREIVGEDVTDQFFDIETRLANLEVLQKRLQKLAEQSGKVEDLLKVERELARVTTEIEQLKGHLKLLSNRVDYLTLVLDFSAEERPAAPRSRTPVSWVSGLGSEILRQNPENARSGYAFDVELPENFAIVSYDGDATYAVNADGATVKLSRHRDLENAGGSFWRDLMVRSLRERGFTDVSASDLTTNEGMSGFEVAGKKMFLGNVSYCYRVLVVRFDDELYLYEGWWPESDTAVPEMLSKSYETLDLSFWR